jgi:hypothetical protein
MSTMTDAVITEYAGTRKDDRIVRFYQYGSGGVRVLDGKKNIRRTYRFDPSSDIMTETDPKKPSLVLRRFVFDRMGMLEETFSQGSRPRTFQYEQGGSQIAVREGGEYGQVGKLFTFEPSGISETTWGRNGEIERVFVFERENDAITERRGGWFGEVERTILFEGINASLFREPEAFLQFLMFTEWSARDRQELIDEQVTQIRREGSGASRGPGRSGTAAPPSTSRLTGSPARARGRSGSDEIEFIPDGDAPPADEQDRPVSRRSDSISFAERLNRAEERGSSGRSAQIPVQERFERARMGRDQPLSKGKSVEIPLQERFEAAHNAREPLSRGRSVEIPLEDRFEAARATREKPKKGKSAEIPYSERRGDRD